VTETTDNDFLHRFKEYLIGEKKSPATIKRYGKLVERMLQKIGKEPPHMTQGDLDEYKISLAKEFCNNSMIPHIAAINSFFANTMKSNLYLKPPPQIKKNTDPLTIGEVQQMIGVSRRNPKHQAVIATLYYAQLRESELRSLKLSDIDFERNKLRVECGKGNRYDTINLHPTAIELIREYLKVRAPAMGNKDYLFTTRGGGKLGKFVLWMLVKECAIKAGIQKRVYPHLFRHSSITHMAEAGARVQDIQKQSRHRDIDTLMDYVHISDAHAKEVYLNTIPNIGSKKSQNTEPETSTGTIGLVGEREMLLLDLLIRGVISEDTYKTGMQTIQKVREKQSKASLSYIG
jgi:integrase/recombinase XerD